MQKRGEELAGGEALQENSWCLALQRLPAPSPGARSRARQACLDGLGLVYIVCMDWCTEDAGGGMHGAWAVGGPSSAKPAPCGGRE